MTGEPELVYHYGHGPNIDLVRVAVGDGRFLHWLELQGGRSGVCVIPTDGERLLVQRQWRPAVAENVWQFPRGFGEGQALIDAARELQQETDIRNATLRTIGRLLPDPGILAGTIVVVEARLDHFPCQFAAPGAPGEPTESIDDYATLTVAELDDWAAAGLLVDGITLAALQLWRVSDRRAREAHR